MRIESWGKRCLEVPAFFRPGMIGKSVQRIFGCILTPQSSEVLDAEGSSRHVPVGFSDGAAPKGIGSCKKVVTFLIYRVIQYTFQTFCCIGVYNICIYI